MSAKILLVGSSGVVGSNLLKHLEGQEVRVTTSKKEKVGRNGKVETVLLDVQTGEGLQAAFEGIERAFLMSPGGIAEQYSVFAPQIAEAKRRGLKKVVLLSAFGVDKFVGAPMQRAEAELQASGLNYAIIRPNWFMQNFVNFWGHGIKNDSQIALPVADSKTSFIDARDIGAVAAKLLLKEGEDKKGYDLTGSESLTHKEVATIISKATGKPVSFQDIEPAALKKGLLGAGLNEPYSDFLLVILGAVKAGMNEAVTGNVEQILGRKPISFKQYAEETKQAWV
jgi:uncharacterized protein YbjT (DUF2867 family)